MAKNQPTDQEQEFSKMVRRKTVISFSWFFFFILIAFALYKYIINQPMENRALKPFRKVMDVNAKIFSRSFSEINPVPEFQKAEAVKKVRVNGDLGLKSKLDSNQWKLTLIRYSALSPAAGDTVYITLDEIKSLPKTEVVFNFKCIEGWSQITWWGGVTFSTFLEHYHAGTYSNSAPDQKNHPEDIVRYAGLETPDGEYYVGIDMASMLQPQTILCYEMNGQPLPDNQGAPLRLIIPVKYGIKHIKRIGTIFFSDSPPRDYWAERGYDFYSGL